MSFGKKFSIFSLINIALIVLVIYFFFNEMQGFISEKGGPAVATDGKVYTRLVNSGKLITLASGYFSGIGRDPQTFAQSRPVLGELYAEYEKSLAGRDVVAVRKKGLESVLAAMKPLIDMQDPADPEKVAALAEEGQKALKKAEDDIIEHMESGFLKDQMKKKQVREFFKTYTFIFYVIFFVYNIGVVIYYSGKFKRITQNVMDYSKKIQEGSFEARLEKDPGLPGSEFERMFYEINQIGEKLKIYDKLKTDRIEFYNSTVKSVLSEVPFGAMVVNEEKAVVGANASALRHLGFEEEKEILGKALSSVASNLNVVDAVRKAFGEQQVNFQELNLRDPLNQIQQVQLIAMPLFGLDMDLIGCLVFFKNVTGEKEMDKMRTKYLDMLSSELSVSIAAIREALSSLLLEVKTGGRLSVKSVGLIGSIKEEFRHLLNMDEKLKDLYNAENNLIENNIIPLDLKETLKKAADRQDEALQKKHIDVKIDVSPEVGVVHADTYMLEKMLDLLLENAVIASPEESKIEIYAFEKDKRLVISIEDFGSGIEKEEGIFKKFSSMWKNEEEKLGHPGLGLFLVKNFATLAGGDVRFSTRLNKGTKFELLLPLTQGDSAAVSSKKNIIIAHRDVGIVAGLKNALEEKGFDIDSAGDGVELLSLISSKNPDLIVMQLSLPKIPALDLLKNLKKDERTENIPTVILAGEDESKSMMKAHTAGATVFHTGGPDINKLLSEINAIFSEMGKG